MEEDTSGVALGESTVALSHHFLFYSVNSS